MNTASTPGEANRDGALTSILNEFETGFSRWQYALLRGGLAELQECTGALTALCGRLGKLLAGPDGAPVVDSQAEARSVVASAQGLRQQARTFLAVLRRVRRNLEIHQQALQGRSELYVRPATTHPQAAV